MMLLILLLLQMLSVSQLEQVCLDEICIEDVSFVMRAESLNVEKCTLPYLWLC